MSTLYGGQLFARFEMRATLMTKKSFALVLIAAALLSFGRTVVADVMLPQQWHVFELTFSASQEHTSPIELHLTANFVGPSGVQLEVPGFWDGGNTWRVRFAPPIPGDWHYRTVELDSADSGLDGQTGAFTVQPASGGNPLFTHGGFLKTSKNSRYLTYSDGTPFFWMGDTWWFCPSSLCPIVGSSGGSSESMFKTLVDVRKGQGYTVVQMLFAGFGRDMPALFSPEKWKEMDIRHWRRMDDYFSYANEQGIIPFVGIGFSKSLDTPSLANLTLLWRYVVARYGAFAVGWLVAGEYNKDNNSSRVEKLMALGQFIKGVDPYKRAMSIHPWHYGMAKSLAWNEPWYDFIMLQGGHLKLAPVSIYANAYHHEPKKPVLESESNYEGMTGVDAARVRLVAYHAIQSGSFGYTYGSHGLWYPNQNAEDKKTSGWGVPIPWWEALHRPGGAQMAYLSKLYQSVSWWNLEPRPGAVFTLEKLSEEERIVTKAEGSDLFVIYYPSRVLPGVQTMLLGTDTGATYNATWFDPRTGESTEAASGRKNDGRMLALPDRPDGSDWILIVRKAHGSR